MKFVRIGAVGSTLEYSVVATAMALGVARQFCNPDPPPPARQTRALLERTRVRGDPLPSCSVAAQLESEVQKPRLITLAQWHRLSLRPASAGA